MIAHHAYLASVFYSQKYGNTWALWIAGACLVGALIFGRRRQP